METQNGKHVPFYKRPIIFIYAFVALAGMAILVYISLILNLSPTANALVGAVIASVIGFLAPRPADNEQSTDHQQTKKKT